MSIRALVCMALLGSVQLAAAQSEEDLKRYFEGKTVIIRIDMPGTKEGVDVFPLHDRPIDFPKLAARLKKNGTAIQRGDDVMITKIKVKKEHIEFQFGGGGYGTFFDDDNPDISTPATPKSKREKELEKDLDDATNDAAKKRIRKELDELRRDREKADRANEARVKAAEQIKEANIRERRLAGGSRFNIRYDRKLGANQLTPESVIRALEEYVDFAPMEGGLVDSPPGEMTDLRKGLSIREVDDLLGRPSKVTERMEGSLRVSVSIYRSGDQEVSTLR